MNLLKTKLTVVLSLLLIPGVLAPVFGAQDHRYHDRPDTALTAPLPEDYQSPPAPVPSGQEIRKYAVDDTGPGATNFGVAPLHDNLIFATLRSHRFEWRTSDETSNDVFLWDLQAWVGSDFDRFYLETEGEWEEGHDEPESFTLEALYGHAITPFWDVRVGLSQDIDPEPERTFAVLGLMGMAPQWIETDLNLLVGEKDDYRIKGEFEYNLLLTQRWILQPRLESQLLFRDQLVYGLGQGITDVEAGMRLRYEIHRKFAPYLGFSYEAALGETRNIVQASGDDPDAFFVVAGLRFWY